METLNIEQALSQINNILEKAFSGEEIIIKKNGQQMIKISWLNKCFGEVKVEVKDW